MKNLFDVKGKTVLITGASSGIGAHIAAMFVQQGANVVLAARRMEKLETLAVEVASREAANPTQLLPVSMDVDSRDSVETGLQAAISHFGQIDILINNAGIARTARLLDMSETEWRSVVDTNLGSVWRVAQVVARKMLEQQRGGVIVNIASILGFVAQKQNANYGAAKSAVVHLTKSMALEWGGKGIRVNAIAPGYFETEINRSFLKSDKGSQYISTLFPGRAGKLSELEGPILLLASDAGSYINGSVITVDGGTLLSAV